MSEDRSRDPPLADLQGPLPTLIWLKGTCSGVR